jgi:hypothetical protein
MATLSRPAPAEITALERLMRDYLASVEKLRTDAAEAALIRDLAPDTTRG